MDYTRNAKEVAKDLIGRKLDIKGQLVEIVETEAYEGGEQTARRYCMKLAPGQVGIMPYRGLDFVNIGTQAAGEPSCVLIRAVKIGDTLIDGPGRVGKAVDAKNIEYLVLGKDIPVSGRTKDSDFFKPEDISSNSKGRYRLR